ncbi:hypothetical protein HZS61_016556 [Fusarium oxysporum f. sp. conglutinans]|uniref:chitinase n=1 Tax=Fusarium oxysporum f. sp. conglutinans TaxID=100902 RepID=A0A8H6GKL6_FUSOX|nr:hypothetical protein HZS61_016556 [Fusarium oxysporum f. sp. conglutinans]
MAQVMPPKPMANLSALVEKEILPLIPPGDSSPWKRLDNSFTFYPDSPPLSSPSSDTDDLDQSLCQSVEVSQNDEPVIAVIGVGYVGTHLVSSFSLKYQVIGFDVSAKRIKDLGLEYQEHENVLPTLLRPDKTIDSSYLRDALKTVGEVARSGSTVVIESSVAIGMTRQLLGPLAANRQFFAGMSPERVDPGRVEPPVQSIPKIISGLDDITPGSLDAINRVYSTIFETVIPVSKPEVAEMMKLYENCQRMVCIAYANEMADACIPHGINPYEVCEAASTKPFGYMPYSPGVGVGGHCIPVNPFYLLSNSHFPLLEYATLAMHSRPSRLAERMLKRLRQRVTEQISSGVSLFREKWMYVGQILWSSNLHYLNVNEDGTLRSIDDWGDNNKVVDGEKGCLAALRKLKGQHPHIKTLVSIGGGSSSKEFPALAASKAARQTFARQIKEFCDAHHFDGVDVDWEHPQTPEAGKNYVLYLQAIRETMPAPKYLLTSALPTGEYCLKHLNLPVVAQLLDFLNLMGYDFTGGWTDVCGHHAQLLPPSNNLNEVYPTLRKSCQRGVDYLTSQGFPNRKIILGIPAYARYFGQARGPGHPFKGSGEIDYCDLPDEWVAGAKVEESIAAASFVDTKGDKGFVSFDVPSTVCVKARYAKAMCLGGLFYWTGAGDRAGPESLVAAGWKTLHSK